MADMEAKLRELHDVTRCDSVECERGFDCYWIAALKSAAALALEDAADVCGSMAWNLDHAARTIRARAAALRDPKAPR